MPHKISVLIVDDSPQVCEAMKVNLERTKRFTVQTAQDGRVGLRLAQKIVPDVIVLDIMLPGQSGGQIAEQLRELHSTQRIPIIFITGMITKAEIEQRGGEIGGEIFLAKPVSTEELIATIHSVLKH